MVGPRVLKHRNGRPAPNSYRLDSLIDTAFDFKKTKARQGLGSRCPECDAITLIQKGCERCKTWLMSAKQRMRLVGGSLSDESDDEAESESESEQPYLTGTDEESTDREGGSDVKENGYSKDMGKHHKSNNLSGVNYSGSGASREKAKQKDPDFIKMNSRPMMEMKGGSNVWFQARIVKEKAAEVLVTFPGVTEDEEDTKEWVSKLSGRIWYGEYRTKAWKYLGKGSWRPKASTKMKVPPLVAKLLREREETGAAYMGKYACKRVENDQQAACGEVRKSSAQYVLGEGTCGDRGMREADEKCELTSLSKHASAQQGDSTQGSRPMNHEESALASWFHAHFENLKAADLFDDHPAGYSALEVEHRTDSHRSASTSREVSLKEGSAHTQSYSRAQKIHTTTDGALDQPASVQQSHDRNSGEGKSAMGVGKCSRSSPVSDSEEEAELLGKRRHSPSNQVLDSDVDGDSEEKPRKRPPVRGGRTNTCEGAANKYGVKDRKRSPRKRRSKEWKPPKELCDLLDGMFEGVQPRGGRQHLGSRGGSARETAQHSSAGESKSDDDDGNGDTGRGESENGVQGQSLGKHEYESSLEDRKPQRSRDNHRAPLDGKHQHKADVGDHKVEADRQRKTGAKTTRRPIPKVPRPAPTTHPRGRVLLSDSEEDSGSDSDEKQRTIPCHKPHTSNKVAPCADDVDAAPAQKLPSYADHHRANGWDSRTDATLLVGSKRRHAPVQCESQGTPTDNGNHHSTPRPHAELLAPIKQEIKPPSYSSECAKMVRSGDGGKDGGRGGHAGSGQAVPKKYLLPPNKDAAFRVAAGRQQHT